MVLGYIKENYYAVVMLVAITVTEKYVRDSEELGVNFNKFKEP